MKAYTTKSTAQRAAAAKFGVKNSAAEVAKVARVFDMAGEWHFEALGGTQTKNEKAPAPAPTKKSKAKAAPVVKKAPAKAAVKRAANAKQTWARPGDDTITGRVWELADKLVTRAKVMEAGIAEGINPGTISQQYHRWNHQS